MKTFKPIGFAALALLPWIAANASDPLTLSFQRTGTDASSVTVSSSIADVNASLVSVSHTLKSMSNTSAICPDVNGNSSPTITITFSLSNLPADWTFNNIGLDIHAFNGSGGNQVPNDNKNRHFNVTVTSGTQQLVSHSDLDPAAGIEGVRKVWDAATASTIKPTSPYEFTITVTKGTDNQGCFFGLEGVTLSTVGTEPGPGPEPGPEPVNSKFYTIKWKNNTQSYMTEQADGYIAIGSYSTSARCFWEFIPTDKDDCYYIRSVASGKYLGSCNMTPSSASRVRMSDTPVEYYIHLSAATSGQNSGCYWMSSTDCDNYDKENQQARCLNKDGNSDYIITWQTSVSNVGSYWTLTETENLYEPKPFNSQANIGKPAVNYYICSTDGKSYNHSGNWQTYSPVDNNAKWYFVGTSNAAGGYMIVNSLTNEALNSGTKYLLEATEGSAPYKFRDADGNLLSLNGTTEFTFIAARSEFAISHQLYQIPCGSIDDTWIASVLVGNDLRYPMATVGSNGLNNATVTSKPAKYNMLTRDAATVVPGAELPLSISFNKAPAAEYSLTIWFDWNRDGIFETSKEIECSQNIDTTVDVPADAEYGKTRMRIRLNKNGLTGADDDIAGEVLDLFVNVTAPAAEPLNPIVKSNDTTRGTAEWANNVATATALGNALFLYWQEGHRITGVDATCQVEPSALQRTLVAVFTPNTAKSNINCTVLNKVNTTARILCNAGVITVEGADAEAILLFATDGRCVAEGAESLIVSNITPGIYIAKAITAQGVVSAKLKL